MSHALVTTTDGALAVRCLTTDEVMHPGVGPRVEAEQLYVGQSRLAERLAAAAGQGTAVTVFDIGLGAGSNAIAARAVAARTPGAKLELVSFERDLGAIELALSQPGAFGLDGEMGDAARALLAHGVHDSAHTRWRLHHGDVLEALAGEAARADVVYWDPFSPKSNPTLWSVAAFAVMRRAASDACTLFTYSASTATRVAMLLGGWAVGVGDAIGTKAQTTAAAVRVADLARPLERAWLSRLARADAPLPADARREDVARLGEVPQFR